MQAVWFSVKSLHWTLIQGGVTGLLWSSLAHLLITLLCIRKPLGAYRYGKEMSLRKTNDSSRRFLDKHRFTAVYLQHYVKDHLVFLGKKRMLAA